MLIPVKTQTGIYNIVLERGVINKANEYIDLCRKVLVVTDDGVPAEYAQTVAQMCESPFVVTISQGEQSKNLKSFELLLSKLVEYGFTRSDCVVAVGGGVVGDLSGFAASTYMRGIDFYNIPTTLLSQVDSSVGGKTAIDFMGIKNIVGAFYPPKAVLIDPETLSTLPRRQLSNGLAEALKMSMTHDKELFEIFENGDIDENIDIIIEHSLRIKKSVVESDEKENGLRRVLNFGHTLAHAIESANEMESLYHGESVAIGMVPMCDESVRERLITVLKKLGLPYCFSGEDLDTVITACSHDKKLTGNDITIVYVNDIGSFEFRKMPFAEFIETVRKAVNV
ncbi:MAG: 3-dehydroquinate synthase [Ruminococcaceae bacterium]|nr:3-dehydroquinate synthase [Oscillospiraceae bacterium]